MALEEGPKIDYTDLQKKNPLLSLEGLDTTEQKTLLADIRTQIEEQKQLLEEGKNTETYDILLDLIPSMLKGMAVGRDERHTFLEVLTQSMPTAEDPAYLFSQEVVDAFIQAEAVYVGEVAEVIATTQEELALLADVASFQYKDIKKYFTEVLSGGDKETGKILKDMLHDIKKVNAPSFFTLMFNDTPTASETGVDREKVGYVSKGKRLDGGERDALEDLMMNWYKAFGDNGNPQVKKGFQYLAAVYGSADFVEKKKEAEGGKLFGYIDQAENLWQEEASNEKGLILLQHLVSDTDLDGDLEDLTQFATPTKKTRKRLEKAQKKEGRGVVSEQGIGELFSKALRKINSEHLTKEERTAEDKLAGNLVAYITQQPKFAYLRSEFTEQTTMVQFIDVVFAHPELVGYLRDYARMVPDDFVKILEGGASYVAQRASTQRESAQHIDEDRTKIEAYLDTPDGKENTAEFVRSLQQKFRGIALSLDMQKEKIGEQLDRANNGVEEMDDETRLALVQQYTALNTAEQNLKDPATAKRTMVDIVHMGGLVSIIPDAQGVGAGLTFRFYEAQAKSLLQTIDMQIGGFKGIGGPGATGIGLNIVFGGTLAQSKKNTLFYALHGGTGLQLVQKIAGFGWNAGLTFGDEFWVNERKMKKLSPTSKVMVGAIASVGISGDFSSTTPSYKPWSAQAGLYVRRDKLAGLEAQQGEIYVTIQEILSKATDPRPEALRVLITEYCKEQHIKQTREEIDRVARVLSSVLMPYGDQLTSFQQTLTTHNAAQQGEKEEDREKLAQPSWMAEIAEQIARNRFNSSTDDVAGFALTGFGVGAGFNFLGIYPAVGVQAQIRKSSVYREDKDSQVRAQAAFEQAMYDEKFEGSFADNVEKINTRFGLDTPTSPMLGTITRKVATVAAYDFVTFPEALLTSEDPRVELWVAPILIDDATSAFHFQKTERGFEIPGTVPVSIVDEVRDGETIHKMIIGDTFGRNAIPLTADTSATFASDDAWIEGYQEKTEAIFFEEKLRRIQEQLFSFLSDQVTIAGWNLPFELSKKENIIVLNDPATHAVTGYKIKIYDNAYFSGDLPEGVSVGIDNGEYFLELPAYTQLNMVYSESPSDASAPWILTTTENTTGLAFGYGVESGGFSQTLDNDFNIDLLTNVDQELEDFISSNEGAEMLMAWRYDTAKEKDKNEYYTLIKDALKSGDYNATYAFANNFIQRYGTPEVQQVFTDMASDGIDQNDRANLYLLYGALSRVRMTEYKHLSTVAGKLEVFDTIIEGLNKNQLSRLSDDDKTYLRCVVEGSQTCDPSRVAGILRNVDARFTGWGDGQYYYGAFPRKDPMYRLIFLLTPVSKVFETRTSATTIRLDAEFDGDKESKTAIIKAYQAVQNQLNTNPNKLFADQENLTNDVGLVFGYGPNEIDEKFVFYPKSTGQKIDLSSLTEGEQDKVKAYYLDRYMDANPHDVKSELDSIISGIEKAFNGPSVDLSEAEKQEKIVVLKTALLPGGTFSPDAYKQLMMEGTINGLDRFNTGADPLVTFSTDRGLAAYSECVNFMITKGKSNIHTKLKKVYTFPIFEPAPVDLQMVSHPGDVVAEQVVLQNQADRRVQNISLGLIGGVFKDPETGESYTLPVDISEEDFNNITLDPTPSSVTIVTTGEQVNAFAGSLGNTSGVFYIESSTGNWKFFEGTVNAGPNNTLLFTPASNGANVNVSDIIYTGRHQGMLGERATNDYIVARFRGLPYDAYQKQMIDMRKSYIESIKAMRKKSKTSKKADK